MSDIVIFHEKHGPRRYDLQANGGFSRICLAIFRERDARGWYGFKDGAEPKLPPKPTPPKNLENAAAVAQYATDLQAWQQQRCRMEEGQDEKEYILLARKGDMAAARTLIELRADHQYEGYTTEQLDTIPEDIPFWVFTPEDRVIYMADVIQDILDQGVTDETRASAEDAMERAFRTAEGEGVEPPLLAPTSKEESLIMNLHFHLRKLLRHPGEIRFEDSARRFTTTRGICTGEGLTQRRCRQYGTVEAVLDARMESRFPPGSRVGQRTSTAEKERYREGLRQELLGYLEEQES